MQEKASSAHFYHYLSMLYAFLCLFNASMPKNAIRTYLWPAGPCLKNAQKNFLSPILSLPFNALGISAFLMPLGRIIGRWALLRKETTKLKEAEAEAAITWVEAEADEYKTVEAEAEAEAVDFKNLEAEAEAEAVGF